MQIVEEEPTGLPPSVIPILFHLIKLICRFGTSVPEEFYTLPLLLDE